MTEEEKRQEQLLLLLLALSQQTENQINRAYRPQLVEAMRRIRRLIQQMSPTGQFRALEWNQIAPQVPLLLEPITTAMREAVLPEIQQLLPEVQDAAYDFSRPEETEPQEIQPVTQEQLLNTLQIAGAGSLLLMIGNDRGINRLTLGMASDLNKLVRGMILAEKTTQEISDKVLKLITSKGKVVAKVNTGSFANQMWARSKNTVAAVVWDGVSQQLMETWKDVPAARWRWNARLDPKTCPICRPLSGKILPKPVRMEMTRWGIQAPGVPGYPPIHANCRCSILPLFGPVEST